MVSEYGNAEITFAEIVELLKENEGYKEISFGLIEIKTEEGSTKHNVKPDSIFKFGFER